MASIRKYSASLEGKSKERYQQKLALIDGVDPYTIPKKDWSEKVDDYPSISYPDIVNYLIFTPCLPVLTLLMTSSHIKVCKLTTTLLRDG